MHANMGVFKPDWREAQERMTAWWQGRPVDRVPASVTAPIKPAQPRVAQIWNKVPEKYTDPETVFHNLECRLERTFWGGEAFPSHFVYAGPMFCVTYLGAEPVFADNTTWYEPCCRNVRELQALRFNPENRWWQLSKHLTRLSLERSQGRYLTQWNGELMAVMDVIAALLGTERALTAMLEEPDAVLEVRDRMMAWSRQTYDEGYAILKDRQAGGIDWMSVWAPGRVISSQCDMSVMISPAMFRDFVAPELADIYEHVDYGIYHLDGPEQIRHLDLLLGIEALDLIQWMPGSRLSQPDFGNPLNWLEFIRRVQEGGKKILIYCRPGQVKPLLNKVARDRIYLTIYCPDQAEAEKVLRELDQIGV